MKAIRKLLAASMLILCQTANAQQQPLPTNPVSYGFWQFTATNGMRGTLTLVDSSCRYTITSSFSNISAFCSTRWDADLGELQINGMQEAHTHNVPVYHRDNGQIINYQNQVIRYSPYAFHIKRISPNAMTGHLLGAGQHVTVKFKRH